MAIHEFYADGHHIRIDEDRLDSVKNGNGDPGGDGPIATCDGNEIEIFVGEDDLESPGDGIEFVTFGSNGDGINRQVDALEGLKKTEGYTTAAAYNAGNGEPVSEEELPELLQMT